MNPSLILVLNKIIIISSFPLQQARQAYRSMDVDLRRSLLTSLETAAAKHKLPTPTRATFLLHRPHAPVVAALDVVYAIMALIEHVSRVQIDEVFHFFCSTL